METIILARHGETSMNAEGLLRGLADPDLSDRGRAQAEALADEVTSRFDVRLVVSTPLQRARHTAAAVAARVGAEVQVDAELNDRDYGPWTGKPRADVIAEWGSLDAAPGVESPDAVVLRAYPALGRWADQAAATGGVAVVVTHDAVIRPLLVRIDAQITEAEVPTGSYQVLQRDSDGWRVVELDRIPVTAAIGDAGEAR